MCVCGGVFLVYLLDFPTRKDKQLDLILTTHLSYICNSVHDSVLYDTTRGSAVTQW